MRAVTNRFDHNWDWGKRLGRWAPLVNCIVIITIAHSLAELTWRIAAPAASEPLANAPTAQANPAGAPSGEPNPHASTDPDPIDVATIASWNLFGTPQAVAPMAAVEVPETQLNLRLAGVFYTHSPDVKPRALIAQNGALERSFGEGDELSPEVRIQQILPDQVVLTRNGRAETLKMPRESQDSSPSLSDPNTAVAGLDPLAAPSGGEATTIQAGELARRLRAATQANPESLQDLAYANPYLRDGQFVGLQLKPGRDRKLLRQLGLHSGDVLTELNGVRLTDASQGIALLQQVLQADHIEAKVLRGSVEIPYTFVLNE